MATLSTHVLDLDNGAPAIDLMVELHTLSPNGEAGSLLASGKTDSDGRVTEWPELPNSHYVLTFATGSWFAGRGVQSFYPRIRIEFIVDEERHYHVPLLLNRFGFSSYRGS